MDAQITLTETAASDLPEIHAIEQGKDTQAYIFGYSLEEHQKAFASPRVTYLNICVGQDLVGFFILAAQDQSLEFRRIVIQDSARGIGQRVIPMMEAYCRERLNCRRIWLDVLADNRRAKHVYEKLGYQPMQGTADGGASADPALLLYEKLLLD